MGGILVMGLPILSAAPLFAGANLLVPWFIWAGIRAARREQSALESRPQAAPRSTATLAV